jgi:hypothetical protein
MFPSGVADRLRAWRKETPEVAETRLLHPREHRNFAGAIARSHWPATGHAFFRTTSRLHSTPVDVIEAAGHRWLVAGYGPSNWARNARATGQVALRRSRRFQRYTVTQPGPSEAVPVPRRYMTRIRVTGLAAAYPHSPLRQR